MNIIFNEEAKAALKELINSSQNRVIRLKVLAFGWSKPALGLVLDERRSEDEVIKVDGITFLVNAKHTIYFQNTEIIYNPKVFNGGFYVHQAPQNEQK